MIGANLDINAKTIGAAAAAVVILYWLAKREVVAGAEAVGDAAVAVGQAVNPVNKENVFNRAVSGTVQAVTGRPDDSLGAWLFRATHPDAKI